jgi:hypothetical protein
MIWTHTLTSITIILLFIKVISSSQNKKLIIFLRDLQLPLAISFSLGTLALTFMDLKDDSLIEKSIFPIMAFKMIHIVIGSIMSVISDFIFAISKDFKPNEDQNIE